MREAMKSSDFRRTAMRDIDKEVLDALVTQEKN